MRALLIGAFFLAGFMPLTCTLAEPVPDSVKPAPSASSIFATAVSDYRQGNYESCIALINKCLQRENKAEYHYYLGLAFLRSKKFAEAEAELETASKLAPTNETYKSDYKHALEMGEFCSNNFGDGVSRSRNSEVGAPRHIQETIRDYEIALSRQEDAQVRLNLGTAYQSEGRLAESLRCYEKALQIDPTRTDGHYFAGTVYEGLNKPDKAKAQYNLYLQKDANGEHADACRARLKRLLN